MNFYRLILVTFHGPKHILYNMFTVSMCRNNDHLLSVNATTRTMDGNTFELYNPLERENFDISCTSTGAPLPSFRWTLNGQATRFIKTDSFTDYVITFRNVTTVPSFHRQYQEAVVSPGVTESTLHIQNFQSRDEGIYECIGSNIGRSTSASSFARIYVFFRRKLIRVEVSC